MDYEFTVSKLGPTFIHVNGRDCTEIDFFLVLESHSLRVHRSCKLDMLASNSSDHYPISCEIVTTHYTANNDMRSTTRRDVNVKVNWKRVNTEEYKVKVTEKMKDFPQEIENSCDVDVVIDRLHKTLYEAAHQCSAPCRKKGRKQKLSVWNDEIKEAIMDSKQAHWQYKQAMDIGNVTEEIIKERKSAKHKLRSEIRQEHARRNAEQRNKIMEARQYDANTFYSIIRMQRTTLDNHIMELTVGDEIYKGQNMMQGWVDHFSKLSDSNNETSTNLSYDTSYRRQVDDDFDMIYDICSANTVNEITVTTEDISVAIKKLHCGKAPDAYGIMSEHIVYLDEEILSLLCNIYNAIFNLQTVPDVLKLGTISPVFKKKGKRSEAKNYRGITVLPVLGKLLEIVVRDHLRIVLDPQQNPLQRGFTAGSSPLNCALLMEEFIRECQDIDLQPFLALLDAKSAFDVVRHNNLFRKLYISGVQGSLWNIIYSLHNNSVSAVKWGGQRSCTFNVTQGGILSADLYKLYVNDLLNRIFESNVGGHIGDIPCNAPTCADDMSSTSSDKNQLQQLCNMAKDYSEMEHYQLQPTKSVVLPISKKGSRKTRQETYAWKIGDTPMPIVDNAVHVGVKRTSKPTPTGAIEENISKARKTMYSLMSSGLHGNNGLDPGSCIHLLKVYVIPVLLYGLEIQLPTENECKALDNMLKRTLKQILSLPTNTADPAPYILSGILPPEGSIHIRALTFFGNICRLPHDSLEKRIATRQLAIKGALSNSWFVQIQRILVKYDLPNAHQILQDPPSKSNWRGTVLQHVNNYWSQRLSHYAEQYTSLKFMDVNSYKPGRVHSLLHDVTNSRAVARYAVKIKMVTGTYILQSTCNRASFNNSEIDPICLLCGDEPETLLHFFLKCEKLQATRTNIMCKIEQCMYSCTGLKLCDLSDEELLQLILDVGKLETPQLRQLLKPNIRSDIEHHTRRLCYALHTKHYYLMSMLPTRKRDGL
ncbi:hypothetical protein FSP39_009833 [Pinctada imbricata]|uniref:Reverse transcriptase domain-containing protein n=1 Tax=Pinctada imbricata TaxID=66713 RepID=A0AA88YDR5_PINIB|nr:hypothetical protein FSP39_009833 [Pinctada imbricata]